MLFWSLNRDGIEGYRNLNMFLKKTVLFVLRIRDVYPGSRIRKINPQYCFKALGNMIRDEHPGSGSRILIFYPSRIPGSKRHQIPDQQHFVSDPRWVQCKSGDPSLPPHKIKCWTFIFFLFSVSKVSERFQKQKNWRTLVSKGKKPIFWCVYFIAAGSGSKKCYFMQTRIRNNALKTFCSRKF